MVLKIYKTGCALLSNLEKESFQKNLGNSGKASLLKIREDSGSFLIIDI